MVTKTKKEIQAEAKKLQSNKISYMQALELIAKKYGFKSYAALKVVVFDTNNINPFGIEFDYEWLDSLIEKGIINQSLRNDITILCVSAQMPEYEYEIKKEHLLRGFYDWFILKPKTYEEKILNSLLIFYSNVKGYYESILREKVNSDFWNNYYKEDVNDFISNYKGRKRVRFRIIENEIPFIEFNFKKKETTLYIKEKGKEKVKIYQRLFSKQKIDLILKFHHIKAFPFYNVSKIVLIPYMFATEGIEITKRGIKDVSFRDRYFNM